MSKSAKVDAKALVIAARKIRRRAHAPYSRFKVGAAILCPNGQIHLGANVENAAYPEGICAEGAAIAAMVAAGDKKISAIAVAADPAVSPCGGCRQKIAEFGTAETLVFMTGTSGAKITLAKLGDLLPLAFGKAGKK
jgi:cytidine deaminase